MYFSCTCTPFCNVFGCIWACTHDIIFKIFFVPGFAEVEHSVWLHDLRHLEWETWRPSEEALEVNAELAGLLRGKDWEVADSSSRQQEQTGKCRGWRVACQTSHLHLCRHLSLFLMQIIFTHFFSFFILSDFFQLTSLSSLLCPLSVLLTSRFVSCP